MSSPDLEVSAIERKAATAAASVLSGLGMIGALIALWPTLVVAVLSGPVGWAAIGGTLITLMAALMVGRVTGLDERLWEAYVRRFALTTRPMIRSLSGRKEQIPTTPAVQEGETVGSVVSRVRKNIEARRALAKAQEEAVAQAEEKLRGYKSAHAQLVAREAQLLEEFGRRQSASEQRLANEALQRREIVTEEREALESLIAETNRGLSVARELHGSMQLEVERLESRLRILDRKIRSAGFLQDVYARAQSQGKHTPELEELERLHVEASMDAEMAEMAAGPDLALARIARKAAAQQPGSRSTERVSPPPKEASVDEVQSTPTSPGEVGERSLDERLKAALASRPKQRS